MVLKRMAKAYMNRFLEIFDVWGWILEPLRVSHRFPVVLGYGKFKSLRKGRGFSLGEIKKVGLTLGEAERLGIYVDKRRKTIHQENIEVLRDLVELVKSGAINPPVKSKPGERRKLGSPAWGRAFRGLTSAGKKSRGLMTS
jgi:large subunit ribosomal protein L13e